MSVKLMAFDLSPFLVLLHDRFQHAALVVGSAWTAAGQMHNGGESIRGLNR
jgi:hypothetical protein